MRTVLEKVANASKVRVARAPGRRRMRRRRKTALEGASMPAVKLVDCRAIGVEGSEIFVVEGDSSSREPRQGRNSEYRTCCPSVEKIFECRKRR